jgi:hypothetical protein
MALEELQLIEQQIGQLDQEIASLLHQHQDAVQRLAEVPGLGVDSAQQIIAEVGAKAATFTSAKNLSSWVGAYPGEEESAGVNYSPRSPKGNRNMRRLLNQAANAAVKRKGSIFEIVYPRLVPRLGHNKTIGAIAHRIYQLIWMKSTARTHRLRVFPYCCATRSGLVLGMFSRRAVRWRLRGFRARLLEPETISLTSYLRDNGFSSFGGFASSKAGINMRVAKRQK